MMMNSNPTRSASSQTTFETAILAIGFIIAAALFLTALPARTFSTLQSADLIYSSLEAIQPPLVVQGTPVARSTDSARVDTVTFTLTLIPGSDPLDLRDSRAVHISYRDGTQYRDALNWTAAAISGNGDLLLEAGEQAQISVDLAASAVLLAENSAFTLEVRPLTGPALHLNRTTPANLEPNMELH